VIERFKQDLKNDLIAGLLVVIPSYHNLTITIANWVLTFSPGFQQLNPFDGMHPILVNSLNLAVGLAVPLLCILVIGLMARNIGRWLLDVGAITGDSLSWLSYKTLKQLLETLLKDTNGKFRRVILVEYHDMEYGRSHL